MACYALGNSVPDVHADAFVHPEATLIGAVCIGAESSIWPGAVLRGDFGRIEVGKSTSIQDGTVIHSTSEHWTIIGSRCVVGHNVHAEGCEIGDGCLIGSGSTILNRARIESGGYVGAAALVLEGTVVPSAHIALGVPADVGAARDLQLWISEAVEEYRKMAKRYRSELRRID
jgi:carbonic anhydrase/acetyltransferase-like protein (isoleucine patch superfamily)